MGGDAGIGGDAGVGGVGGSSSGSAGEGGKGADDCTETPLVERRLVRLSSNQIVNSIETLLGSDVAAEIRATEEIPLPAQRSFPPLATEGSAITESHFALSDRIGDFAGQSVRDAFDACGNTPTDACARDYVVDFAEQAFRRPVSDPERDNLLVVYDECKAAGATIPEAVRHVVWAVFDSPLFLYRTELGESGANAPEVELTAYELASELSYFLTDRPPDADLLDAAASGALSTPDEIAAHTARLLGTEAARSNLEAAMLAYFRLPNVSNVVVDPASVPGLGITAGFFNSLYHESELFMRNTLWDGALGDLLTSRRAWVNETIAGPIYGVPTPMNVDRDGFGAVELPENRAGLLTSAPFLASLSRPDGGSVVGRGLEVNAAVACQMNPPFPEDGSIPDMLPDMSGWSEREKAEYRAQTALCAGCHAQFDPYGLALDVFDGVGRYRTMDLQGRPIDPAVTLPEVFDGRRVSSPAEMARVMAESEVFRRCIAMNFLEFALADTTQGGARAPLPDQPAQSCVVRDVVDAFDTGGDPSFTALVTAIGRSRALRMRRGSQ